MPESAHIHAVIDHKLKHRFFVLLAQRGQSFTDWLRAHMEATLLEEARWKRVVAPTQKEPTP